MNFYMQKENNRKSTLKYDYLDTSLNCSVDYSVEIKIPIEKARSDSRVENSDTQI